MIVNGVGLVVDKPIKNMVGEKVKEHGVSYGLSEVGYDIRIKQEIRYQPPSASGVLFALACAETGNFTESYLEKALEEAMFGYTIVTGEDGSETRTVGRTALASSVEEFALPEHLWGELRNKSSHARKFFDASLGTDMEPGWKGFLTIELVFHSLEPITIPAGSGIAKAVFHELKYRARYEGKYQHQANQPVPTIYE